MTVCTVSRYEQFETSPETIDQELRRVSFWEKIKNKMDTALYFFVLNKKRYVAFRNCLARCSAARGQMESVKDVAYNIVHSFEIVAFSSHFIIHISLTFHRRHRCVVTSVRITEIYNQRKWIGLFVFGGRECNSYFPAGLVLLPFKQ